MKHQAGSRSSRIFSADFRKRRRTPQARRRAPLSQRPIEHLRLVSFNLQNGTPKSGWPDPDVGGLRAPVSREEESGLRLQTRLFASLLGPRSVSSRAQNAATALEETAEVLRSLSPDIVCLQEVDKGQRRSGYLPQAEFLAQTLGMPYWRMTASLAGPVYGIPRRPIHTSITRENGHGLALLSRWPIKSWHVKRLGRARTRLHWGSGAWLGFSRGFLAGIRALPGTLRGVHLVFGKMRVLQAARVLTPLGTVAVGNTHLETHRAVATGQLRRAWTSVFDLAPGNCMLVGDFNLYAQATQEALTLLEERMAPTAHSMAPTYPADAPRYPVDQLLVSGWCLARPPRTVRMPVSDHLAVVYDLIPQLPQGL